MVLLTVHLLSLFLPPPLLVKGLSLVVNPKGDLLGHNRLGSRPRHNSLPNRNKILPRGPPEMVANVGLSMATNYAGGVDGPIIARWKG